MQKLLITKLLSSILSLMVMLAMIPAVAYADETETSIDETPTSETIGNEDDSQPVDEVGGAVKTLKKKQ